MQPTGYTVTDEQRRLALRQERRRDLAKIQVAFEKIAELEAIIRGLDSDADEAADQHATKCRPWQKQLGELDEKRIAAILSGKMKDSSTKRGELQKNITSANLELERTISAIDTERKKVREEIDSLRKQCTGKTKIENELAQLATAEQLDRQFVISERSKILTREAEHYLGQAERHKSVLDNRDKYTQKAISYSEMQYRRWSLAAADAGRDRARLQNESREIREQA